MKRSILTAGLSILCWFAHSQSPRELVEKICARVQADSNFEIEEKPVESIQKDVLVMYLDGGQAYEIETIMTVNELGRRFAAFAAAPGKIKVWLDNQLVFEGESRTATVPSSISDNQFRYEFNALLPAFPGDYSFRIHYRPKNENGTIFLWLIDEYDRVQTNVDFRSDWSFMEPHPYRFSTDLGDNPDKEWRFPPEVSGLQHQSPLDLNDWKYYNGQMLDAMWRASNYFGLDYTNYVTDHLNFFVTTIEKIDRSRTSLPVLDVPLSSYFRYTLLTDYGPQSIPFFHYPDNQSYQSFTSKALSRILYRTTRTANGTFARSTPDSLTIWAEDMYMGIVMLSRAYQVTGSRKYLDEAIKQVTLIDRKLRDQRTGLYWHGYSEPRKERVGTLLARANGLALVGKLELLLAMGEDHPDWAGVMQLFRTQASSVRDYQSEEGRWRQVMDLDSSFLETSASAMFVRAFAEGINNKWLDNREEYRRAAISGWLAITQQIDETGNIDGIVAETPILESDDQYNSQELIQNDPRGIGPVINAAIAIDKLNQ